MTKKRPWQLVYQIEQTALHIPAGPTRQPCPPPADVRPRGTVRSDPLAEVHDPPPAHLYPSRRAYR